MAVTLEEAKVGMADKVDQQVVDMFRRSSILLDALTFDDSISPGTGGSTLTYGYIQLKTPSTADIRTINTEYTPNEAKREEKTAKPAIVGGSFQIDRVIQGTSGAIDEMAFQTEQKIKAAANKFHYLVINGTADGTGATDARNTFDGLKKALAKTQNEFTSTVDLTTGAKTDENCQDFLDELDAMLSAIDGRPDMILASKKGINKIRSCARRAGYYSRSENAFGETVEAYDNIPILDVGEYYDKVKGKSVSAIEDVAATSMKEGTTSIYAVCLGLDGFHGISPDGSKIIKTYLPDMSKPGAVKTGEVELVAGVVLKNTLKAAVLKDVKITPKTGG